MKEIFILFITTCVISFSIYFHNSEDQDSLKATHLNNYSSTSKFNSGISIKDAGEMIVIEQKPHDATVIIDKDDLEDILVFLNNTNESE